MTTETTGVTVREGAEKEIDTGYSPHEEPSSINFINDFVKDGNSEYCSARFLLKKLNYQCPFGNGCQGRLWCCNRDEIYNKGYKRRFLTQLKLVEVFKYLQGLHGKTIEEFDKAYMEWIDSGAAHTFSEAFDVDRVRDLSRLIELCAFSTVDAPLIRDEIQKPAA